LTLAGKELSGLQSENDVLRSLIGRPEPQMLTTILAQNGEMRFNKEQIAALKKELEDACAATGVVRLESEERKSEVVKGQRLREQDQNKFKEDLDVLNKQLKTIGQKVFEKQQVMKQESRDLAKQFEERERQIYLQAEDEIRTVGVKLSTLCRQATGSAEKCMAAVEAASQQPSLPAPATPAKRGFRFKKTPEPAAAPVHVPNVAARLITPLSSVLEDSNEANRIIDAYLQILDRGEPQYARLTWPRFWSELKRRMTADAPLPRNIKIVWPADKNLPPFVTDEKLLLDICENLLRNACESLTGEGTVEIAALVTPTRLVVEFTDGGQGIKSQDMERIFLPFFTTKTGHTGLGLSRARKLARLLGGSLSCEPRGRGAKFILSVPSTNTNQEPPPVKK
jgi:signal transduction histidine kinase